MRWKFSRGKWRRVSVEFPSQLTRTLLLSATIRAIYDKDATLSPEEQHDMIRLLPGLTAREMEEIIPLTGPALADSIRAVISKHRATDRSTKDKAD